MCCIQSLWYLSTRMDAGKTSKCRRGCGQTVCLLFSKTAMLSVFCEHACKKLQLFLCVQAGFNAFILRQFSHVWSWHQRYTANAIWTNLHLLFRSKSFLTSFVKFKLFVPVNTRKHLLNNFNNWRRLAIQNLQKQ